MKIEQEHTARQIVRSFIIESLVYVQQAAVLVELYHECLRTHLHRTLNGFASFHLEDWSPPQRFVSQSFLLLLSFLSRLLRQAACSASSGLVTPFSCFRDVRPLHVARAIFNFLNFFEFHRPKEAFLKAVSKIGYHESRRGLGF